MEKTLTTTAADQAPEGTRFHGNVDMWVCVGKAWNAKEGWMKSTKVLEVPGAGCFLQVTTQQGDNVSEAVTWAPGVMLNQEKTGLELLTPAWQFRR